MYASVSRGMRGRSPFKPRLLLSLFLGALLLVSLLTGSCDAKKKRRIRRPPVMQMRPALFHWGFSVSSPQLFKGKVSRRSLDEANQYTVDGLQMKDENKAALSLATGSEKTITSLSAEEDFTGPLNLQARSVRSGRNEALRPHLSNHAALRAHSGKTALLRSEGHAGPHPADAEKDDDDEDEAKSAPKKKPKKKEAKTKGKKPETTIKITKTRNLKAVRKNHVPKNAVASHKATPFQPVGSGQAQTLRAQNLAGQKNGVNSSVDLNYTAGANNTAGRNGTLSQESEQTRIAFSVVGSIVLIVVGLAFLFTGFAIFKPALFFSGFFLFVLIAVAIMNAVENGTKNTISSAVFFGVCGGVGLVGGLIFLCFWKAGLFALGAILGFVIAAVILSFVSNGSIAPGAGRVVFIVAMCVFFAVLMFFFEKWLYIIGTSIPGAYAVVLGIDGFANIGFRDAALSFLGKGGFQTSAKLWGLIALFGILVIFGLSVQTMLYYGKKKREVGMVEIKADEKKHAEMDPEMALLLERDDGVAGAANTKETTPLTLATESKPV
ncbi:hypothetical protein BC829DRAFT_41031 [Chytridium lagenaria]|nr:hypothetical protein BC829DRAFT_41031 [Chytridium lagenaria]